MNDLESTVLDILRQDEDDPRRLVQMLRQVQRIYSQVPDAAMRLLAERLRVPLTQVRGCVEFYHFLHAEPRGLYDIYFSECLADEMEGGRELACRLANRLGVGFDQPRADGRVSVGFTACTGLCDQGPAALINGRPLPRLDRLRILEIAGRIEAGEPVETWPAEWFMVSNPIRRMDALFQSPVTPGAALRLALRRGPDAVLRALESAGLRGRGGAGFPTAAKWRQCRDAAAERRYVVCNADEGEPGTFKDRVLLTQLPKLIFEGMALAGCVVGASEGLLYLRGEYEYLLPHLQAALGRLRGSGLLGRGILGSDFDFDIRIVLGAGAYVCGEESALIESLEGKRGQVRLRPFPAASGYDGRPTVVNNVQTLIQACQIVVKGEGWFERQGVPRSHGTLLLSVSGDVARRGVYEYPCGVSVAEVLRDAGTGSRSPQAVQVGGPSGRILAPGEFDRRIGFDDLPTRGSLMVFDRHRDMAETAANTIRFFQQESCGFCTPCRVGTALLKERMEKILAGRGTPADLDELVLTGDLVRNVSHCGLGQNAPNGLLDTLYRFRDAYTARLRAGGAGRGIDPGFDPDTESSEARALAARAASFTAGGDRHD